MKKQYKRVYVEITNVCNLNCSFCCGNRREKKFMTVQEFDYVIQEIKPLTDTVYLHVMGEPLMHPQLKEILNVCEKNKINAKITTNARLLEKNREILLSSLALKQVNISLHSFCDGKIEKEKICELMPLIKELANAKKVVTLRFWTGIELNSEIKSILIQNFGEFSQKAKNTKLANYVFLSTDEQFEWPTLERKSFESGKTYCYALNSHFAVLVDGTVVPCCLDSNAEINLGNVFKKPITEILNTDRAKNLVCGFQNGTCTEELCKKCGYRNLHFTY